MNKQRIFDDHESNVRSYCRHFPAIFQTAKGSRLYDDLGRDYIDFFAGAGALNYGHNNDHIKDRVLNYIRRDGITHSLDFHTGAKHEFIERLVVDILRPRKLNYKIQFTGPTGTNAVEAALKLARKVTGRQQVVAFTNGFHGMSLGALAATANQEKRDGSGVPLHSVTRMPYDGFYGSSINSAEIIEGALKKNGSGYEKPAAFIVELVQGEGGLNVATDVWIKRISTLAKELGALLIVDDIQAGCGRTGTFFSFEGYGIEPDLVCLSKSLGGMGLPLSVVLIRPEIDVWNPGEHSGTFRGNNLAFIAGAAALDYWTEAVDFGASLQSKATWLQNGLRQIAELFPAGTTELKGKGLMQGISIQRPGLAQQISEVVFKHGVIAETCGPDNEVLKLMPPMTIDAETMQEGFERLNAAIREVLVPLYSRPSAEIFKHFPDAHEIACSLEN
ncbi:MAG: diaminobutyrate--2-oxoglutarate transaminase [Burkholderiaceae bacterium]